MGEEVTYISCEECKYYAPHWCSDYCHMFDYSIGEPRGCGWGVKKEEQRLAELKEESDEE